MLKRASQPIKMIGLVSTLLLCGGGSSSAQDNAGTISHGKAVYNAVGCYTCHGRVGQGSIYKGPPLVPLDLSDEAIGAYVRAPSGVMPPFSTTILSDKDLEAIGAYLRSFPATRPAAQIPLLAPYVAHAGGK